MNMMEMTEKHVTLAELMGIDFNDAHWTKDDLAVLWVAFFVRSMPSDVTPEEYETAHARMSEITKKENLLVSDLPRGTHRVGGGVIIGGTTPNGNATYTIAAKAS